VKLLLDAGNTRLKWAQFGSGRFDGRGAVQHRDATPAQWIAPLDAAAGQPEAIWVANVAGPVVAHALGEWALERHGLRPHFVHAARAAGGISNAYEHPETLGVDRWLALIAAWRRAPGPLVCIAAGTALTVDAADGEGRHLGGLIVPGYELMLESLLKRTSEIAPGMAVAAPQAEGLFGRNTAAAVDQGASNALAAVAERAIAAATRHCGRAPQVFLGGGDAARLAPLIDVPLTLAPDLVLEGLAVLAGEG